MFLIKIFLDFFTQTLFLILFKIYIAFLNIILLFSINYQKVKILKIY